MITQGLLLWPYLSGARWIAPWVVTGKGREFRPEWMAIFFVCLVVSCLVTTAAIRRASSRERRIMAQNATFISALGILERGHAVLMDFSIVRE